MKIFINLFAIILAGFINGTILFYSKNYFLKNNKIRFDSIFSFFRILFLSSIIYLLFKFITLNNILILIIFLSSYVLTVFFILKLKEKNEQS